MSSQGPIQRRRIGISGISTRAKAQVVVIVAILVLSSFVVGMHFASARPSSSGTSYGGALQGAIPCTFYVFQDGSNYDGMDCATHQLKYGGSGNAGGATGSNASNVLQTISDAMTNGGKIVIGCSSTAYSLSNFWNIKNSFITVEGESLGCVTLQMNRVQAAHGTVIGFRNPGHTLTDLTIENLVIDGNLDASQGIWFGNTVPNFLIYHNEIKNIRGNTAFSAGDGEAPMGILGQCGGGTTVQPGCRILDNIIHDIDAPTATCAAAACGVGAAIWMAGNTGIIQPEKILIQGNDIYTLTNVVSGEHIDCVKLDTNTLGLLFKDNTCENFSGNGVNIIGGGSVTSSNHTVSGNQIYGGSSSLNCISLNQNPSANGKANLITGNTVERCGNEGIDLEDINTIVSNNIVVDNCQTSCAGRGGIGIVGTTSPGATKNLIIGNQIRDDQSVPTQVPSIRLDTPETLNFFFENYIDQGVTFGSGSGKGDDFNNNPGLNPIGHISSNFLTGGTSAVTTHYIGYFSGNSTTEIASQTYTWTGANCRITSADSANSNNAIVIKDASGTTIVAATHTLTREPIYPGYTITWGAFTGAAGAVSMDCD